MRETIPALPHSDSGGHLAHTRQPGDLANPATSAIVPE